MMSWHYVERKENDILISVKVNDDSHATVCTVYGSTSPMNDQYVGASKLTENVNLICAAPDLLEALQMAREMLNRNLPTLDRNVGFCPNIVSATVAAIGVVDIAIGKALA